MTKVKSPSRKINRIEHQLDRKYASKHRTMARKSQRHAKTMLCMIAIDANREI